MKVYVIIFILTVGISACGISKQINKNIGIGIRSIILPRIAISTFLVQSTQSIYELNTVKSATPIFIRSLNAHFFSNSNSFDLHADSINVTIIENKIIFSKVSIKPSPNYLIPDTIEVKVTCKYLLGDSLADHVEKCLLGNYIIYRDSIAQKDKYVPCNF